MKIRWPLMFKSTHTLVVEGIKQHHEDRMSELILAQIEQLRQLHEHFQGLVDAEYGRARQEGISQVHAWAREVNWNLFHGMPPFGNMSGTQRQRTTAALQDAEHQFSPTRTQLDAPRETTDATVRP